jgi:hypothetical protein
MKKVGIWIDREKAFIVTIEDEKESLKRIDSGVEKHIRASGGSRSKSAYGPQDVGPERKLEERRKHQSQRYYQAIAKAVRDAGKILLFGPGEAKVELEKEIKKSKALAFRVVGVEPADRMTEKQIAAKVREHYLTVA